MSSWKQETRLNGLFNLAQQNEPFNCASGELSLGLGSRVSNSDLRSAANLGGVAPITPSYLTFFAWVIMVENGLGALNLLAEGPDKYTTIHKGISAPYSSWHRGWRSHRLSPEPGHATCLWVQTDRGALVCLPCRAFVLALCVVWPDLGSLFCGETVHR